VSPQLRELAVAAHTAHVTLDTAVAVVVERELVIIEAALEAAVVARLDGRARTASPRTGLSNATAAHLRELGRAPVEASALGTSTVVLALPARLNDRIGTPVALARLLAPDTLGSALDWERAALGRGFTLTEWALTAMLDLGVF
jgi:hypothetical protein